MLPAIAFASLALLACARAANWTIIDSDIGFEGIGLAFASDSVGYAGGADGNGHPSVFKTVNAGVNWADTAAKFDPIQLVLDVDATENSVVVATVFGEQYSTDGGVTFSNSTGGGVSMSVRFLGTNGDGGLKYGVTGTYLGKSIFDQINGVGLSVDGGATFKVYDAQVQAIARFGAFPSDTTWYVTAGTWPGENQDDNPTTTTTASSAYRWPARRITNPNAPAETGEYIAQVSKTADGGATWKIVFNSTGEFYFNAIDCAPGNADWCCAVGEGDQDSPNPGARIHCTKDGGNTWNRTLWAPALSADHMLSLIDIQFASPTDVWAGGAVLTTLAPFSWFVYSGDGGLSWHNNYPQWLGMYVLGLSFLDSSHAFALLQDFTAGNAQVAEFK